MRRMVWFSGDDEEMFTAESACDGAVEFNAYYRGDGWKFRWREFIPKNALMEFFGEEAVKRLEAWEADTK